MCFRGGRPKVEVTHHHARYSLPRGSRLQITHHGKTIDITTEQPVSCPISEIHPCGATTAPGPPPGTAASSGEAMTPMAHPDLPLRKRSERSLLL